MEYDVIIVGASIAGATCALNLKKLNKKLKILVIDKCKFPRNKLCAGYLTTKSVNLLKEIGLDVADIDYSLVKGIKIIYKNKVRIHANNHGLYCQKLVDRTVLDYDLFKRLRENGIEVKENIKINNLNEQESIITIDDCEYQFKYLVFADGELGYSSKYNNENKKYFTMQLNFKHKLDPSIAMYFGITKKGYAWCASSGEYINIGFCDIYDKKINYHQVFTKFVKDLGYENELNSHHIKGFFVPYGLKTRKVITDNIYMIGDAVGTVDPLTLAGVSYAILSGKYLAQAIVYNDNNIYYKYLGKLQLKFRILKIMATVLYTPFTMFFGVRVGGHFFGGMFSYILDKFVLDKNGSFHE